MPNSKILKFLALFILSILVSPGAFAKFYMGVSTHAALGRDDKSDVNFALSWLGAGSVRDELYWTSIVSPVGREDPNRQAKNALTSYAELRPANGCLMLVLDYGHPLFVNGLPATDVERKRFSEYVGRALKLVSAPLCAVEVWNEWNIGGGRIGERMRFGSAEDYAKLVLEVIPILRRKAPGVPIVVGALADKDLNWLRDVLLRLRGADIDGVSVHPYVFGDSDNSPAAVQRWVFSLPELIRSSFGKKLSIYVTEIGWPTFLGRGGSGEAQVAHNLVETFVRLRESPDVRGVWWYGLKDKGENPYEKEHGFGLTSHGGRVKPSGYAFKSLASFWTGCEVKRVRRDSRAVLLECGGAERAIVLNLSLSDLAAVSGRGGCEVVDLVKGKKMKLGYLNKDDILSSHVGFSGSCGYSWRW